MYTKTYLFTTTPIKAAVFLVHIVHLHLGQCHFNNSNGFALFAMNILGHSTVRNRSTVTDSQYNITLLTVGLTVCTQKIV